MKLEYGIVLVHSCYVQKPIKNLHVDGCLQEEDRYIQFEDYFCPLRKLCPCKKCILWKDAYTLVVDQQAIWLWKSDPDRKGYALQDQTQIYLSKRRERVPRVDLPVKADIERAYIGSERKSEHDYYDPIRQKYVIRRTIPEGMTTKSWAEHGQEEVAYEARIRKQNQRYIEGCHKVTVEARKELIVAPRDDPFEGRTLFSFTASLNRYLRKHS